MKDDKLPSIAVVIATFNSDKTLEDCLKAVRKQEYPQNKIEIILGDGTSKDNTLKIAKKYKSKVINIPIDQQHAEYNRGVAFNHARNELALILDHDNILPTKNWLQQMVTPLLENPQMVAVETCYYQYDKRANVIDRYSALFGTNEPLPYYLGKADRMPQIAKKWVLKGKAIDMGKYYKVYFEKDPRKIPSVGTNGCLMRRELVCKYADVRPEYHYPIDVMVDVIKSGHNEFGFVKNSIIHRQQIRGLITFLKRRQKFAVMYHFQDFSKRRWSVVLPGDQLGVFKFILYSLTVVKPLYDSLIGFVKIPDTAWFIHPIMCFATTFMYGFATIKNFLLRSHN